MEKLMFVFLVAVTFKQQNAHAEVLTVWPPTKVNRLSCSDRKINPIELFLANLDVQYNGGRLATLIKSNFCKPDFKDVKVKVTSTERLTGEGFALKQIPPFERMLLAKKGAAYVLAKRNAAYLTVTLRQCTPENSPSIFSKSTIDELKSIGREIDAKAKAKEQKATDAKAKAREQKLSGQCVGTFKEDPRRSAEHINSNRSAPGYSRVSEQKSPESTR